jgi:hypothetical protein
MASEEAMYQVMLWQAALVREVSSGNTTKGVAPAWCRQPATMRWAEEKEEGVIRWGLLGDALQPYLL